jgi:hypothetical protein
MSSVSALMAGDDWRPLVLAGVEIAVWILVAEALALGIFRWRTGRGLSFASIALICFSGLGLLLAVKAALAQAGVLWVGLGLTIGGVAHGLDLMRRMKQPSS